MLVAVQRSKKLAFGGALTDSDLDSVRQHVAAAMLSAAQQREPLRFDAEAREWWIAVYDDLADGHPGLWGAATARAEAHTVRLAMLYALLDCSPAIRVEQLDAALAFWRYASQSARWVFGDSLGDPTADEIWEMAKTNPQGVTRTQVSDLFSRNKKAREIDRALTALVGLPGMFDRKRHRSGGDQESAFGLDQALVAVRSVAVGDVVGHRLGERVPVGVVGVLDDELADRPEVALDAVQKAGVGRGEDQLDVGLGGPLADRRRLVGGEVVGDQVDPQARVVAHPDLAVEGEHLAGVLVRPETAVKAVGVHVVGTEQIAHPVRFGVGRAQPLGPLGGRPARPVVGDQLDRPHLVKADHHAVGGLGPVEPQDPFGLGLKVGVRALLPRARALMRQARADQRLAQRLLA